MDSKNKIKQASQTKSYTIRSSSFFEGHTMIEVFTIISKITMSLWILVKFF